MSLPQEGSIMNLQYLEAVEHLNEQRKGKAVEVANLNLTDPNLSRYYRMKNLLLVATADEDWYERERCRRRGEEIWTTANALTGHADDPAQNALQALRKELDQLREKLQASAPDKVDEGLLAEEPDDEEDAGSEVSETEVYGDDEEAVRAAEKEVFGDDRNIVAMYERAAVAGRAAREAREMGLAEHEDEQLMSEATLPDTSSSPQRRV